MGLTYEEEGWLFQCEVCGKLIEDRHSGHLQTRAIARVRKCGWSVEYGQQADDFRVKCPEHARGQ